MYAATIITVGLIYYDRARQFCMCILPNTAVRFVFTPFAFAVGFYKTAQAGVNYYALRSAITALTFCHHCYSAWLRWHDDFG